MIAIKRFSKKLIIPKRAHVLGIDAGSFSMSMGHTLEAHLRAYPYASKANTTNAFKRAKESVAA